MRVSIPNRYDNILLRDFVKYQVAKSDVEKVIAITGASKKTIEGWQASTIDTIIKEYSNAIEQGTPKMSYVLKSSEVDLAFIPDIDAITLREHIDLDTYAQSIWKDKERIDYTHLPNLLAILYRPIKHRFGKWYELERYDVDKVKYYIDIINTMTMAEVNGVLVFFSTILNELVQNSVRYLEEEKNRIAKEAQMLLEATT
jgi:hypothetical protein